MALDPVDVVIVGSGAGGAPMALTLGRAGFKVVVLEKGAHYKKEDFVHDEILNSRRNYFMPFPWDEPHLVRRGEAGKWERTNTAWTANCVGGGTVHMSGYFYRLKPIDFRQRSELGAVPGANVVDWPLRYEEFAPWYDVAEKELGVSGEAVPHPFAEPRGAPYPTPPLAAHPISGEIDTVCKAMGLHPLPTARGIVSTPYEGRSGCNYCTLCGSYGCEVDAKSSTSASLIPKALATGNVTLRTHCMARSIEVSPDGRAKSVVYVDGQGVVQEQPARIVVVSCTAVESARLLLNSHSGRFQKGLANGNGLVGKNLVFSSFGESRATFRISKNKSRWPWIDDASPFVQRSLQDWYVLPNDKHGFRKGGTLGFMWAHPNPIFAAVNLAGSGKAGIFGKALKDKLRDYRDSKLLQFEVYAEFLPTQGTYVSVESDVTDKYGIPVAGITMSRHPRDFAATRYLVERGEEVLKALQPDELTRIGTAGETTILQGGTCRFGKNPATSVLNPDCRTHEVPNLYVVDGSFMPTSGGVPVTLTIAANAFRVGDRLAKQLKA
ncbi:MAG: GMC family oxidoreductase [Myxococcaceae bacterium]